MAETISEKSFAVDTRYANFYAGGDLAWSSDGASMYCNNTKEVTKVDVATGQVVHTYTLNAAAAAAAATDMEVEEDLVYAFTLAPESNEYLATAHRSGLLRLWSVETGKVLKLWKAQHKGPVVSLLFSPCCKLVCSSGADSSLRLWDFVNSRCVAVLRDFPGPAVQLLFHPNAATSELFAVGADNTIYHWNYASRTLLRQLRGHLSQVTALSFRTSEDEPLLASVGRDKVLIVWRLADGTQLKVIPMYEELVGVYWLPAALTQSADKSESDDLLVACSGGSLKTVQSRSARMAPLVEVPQCELRSLLANPRTKQLCVVTAEQNVIVYAWRDALDGGAKVPVCSKQLIGFNDEVLDLCFVGAEDRFLAVATNSKNIKLYDTAADMDCRLCVGHKDTVLTLASAGGDLLLSAGKDQSLLLWQLHVPEAGHFELRCVARHNSSHTASIGCVSFAWNSTSLLASVCQDGSMKVWQLRPAVVESKKKAAAPVDASAQAYNFLVRYAAVAHEKEVNSVTFAPNNKMLATASQDKTARLWSSESQTSLGTLRGHTRGVWCVRFSPVDQIVLTTSADCSLRVWSLANLTCLKRLEHECSVLRGEFIAHGRFVLAGGSDGLIKTWNLKTSACVQTLDEHTDRVWALAVSQHSHRRFYSGGADSLLLRWRDVTKEQHTAQLEQRQATLEQEQTLQTLLHQQRNLKKAFALALRLGRPRTTYNILKDFVRRRDEAAIETLFEQLSGDQRNILAEHVKGWSTNSRHAHIANLVMQHILNDIMNEPENARHYNAANLVEVLTPYTQRHFKRLTETQKDIGFLEYVVQCM